MLETERLILRPSKKTDVAELFEFLGDPTAMQHTHSDKNASGVPPAGIGS